MNKTTLPKYINLDISPINTSTHYQLPPTFSQKKAFELFWWSKKPLAIDDTQNIEKKKNFQSRFKVNCMCLITFNESNKLILCLPKYLVTFSTIMGLFYLCIFKHNGKKNTYIKCFFFFFVFIWIEYLISFFLSASDKKNMQ